MAHCLFVGDISLDLSLQVPHMPAPDEKVHCTASTEGMGGVVTNTAVAFSRTGGSAALGIQLGDDLASSQVRGELEAMRLDLRPATVPGGLCRVVTMIEPHGEKRLLLYPGVSIYPDAAAVAALRLDDIAHLHTACFGPAAEALVARARQSGISWSIDLEPASFSGGITTLAPVLDGARVVFVNDRAADAIGPNPIGRLRDLGVHDVVRTRGPLGAELHRETGEVLYAPPPKGLVIVDTTGAGDCFAGWFLAGLAAGWRINTVLARAVRAASIACTRVGAQTAYPTLSEIEAQEQD